jgi:chromosome segregation ATPase
MNSNEFSDKKEKEIKHLTNEIENLKVILSSYENQNKKITDLEMKLRNKQINFDKKLKNYEIQYKEQINILNKVISNYEEVLDSRKNIKSAKENVNLINNFNCINNKRFTRDFNDEISTLTIVIISFFDFIKFIIFNIK